MTLLMNQVTGYPRFGSKVHVVFYDSYVIVVDSVHRLAIAEA
jgi:hypothetical protein